MPPTIVPNVGKLTSVLPPPVPFGVPDVPPTPPAPMVTVAATPPSANTGCAGNHSALAPPPRPPPPPPPTITISKKVLVGFGIQVPPAAYFVTVGTAMPPISAVVSPTAPARPATDRTDGAMTHRPPYSSTSTKAVP